MTSIEKITKESRRKIRETLRLKNEGKNKREIAKKLKISVRTANKYLTLINLGYDSLTDYNNYLAKKRGYKRYSHYHITRMILKNNKYPNSSYLRIQRKFENELIPFSQLEEIPSYTIFYEDHFKKDLSSTMEEFETNYTKREENSRKIMYEIIKRHFIKEETLEEIGKSKNLTRARIQQIESEALYTLRKIANKNNLLDYLNDLNNL